MGKKAESGNRAAQDGFAPPKFPFHFADSAAQNVKFPHFWTKTVQNHANSAKNEQILMNLSKIGRKSVRKINFRRILKLKQRFHKKNGKF